MGQGYAALTYETYQAVERQGPSGYWQRFFNGGNINVIQCAEQLEGPREVVQKTYSNCSWQNETLSAAQAVAHGDRGQLANLGLQLGLCDYPKEVVVNDDRIAKTAVQYLETHDHSRFVCNFATISLDGEVLREGDRGLWYRVQPYLIGLFAAKGIPMLWQGQEFGENYYVPEEGWGRVLLFANWPGCAENGRSFAMEITSSTMTTNATRCERCCSTPGNMAMISV
jgi:maltooligosyltrehalose trehalohydrolase